MTRLIPDRPDRIQADVEELKRRQQKARVDGSFAYKLAQLSIDRFETESIRQITADIADQSLRRSAEDWKEPEDLVDFAKTGEMREANQK